MKQLLNDFCNGAAVVFGGLLVLAAVFVPPFVVIEYVVAPYGFGVAFPVGLGIILVWLGGWLWAFVMLCERMGWSPSMSCRAPSPPPLPPFPGDRQ